MNASFRETGLVPKSFAMSGNDVAMIVESICSMNKAEAITRGRIRDGVDMLLAYPSQQCESTIYKTLSVAVSNTVMSDKPVIRLAELIGALSHALDLTEGQPRGHCMRVCWIGMQLG